MPAVLSTETGVRFRQMWWIPIRKDAVRASKGFTTVSYVILSFCAGCAGQQRAWAAFRSRRGASFQILRLLRARRFEIALSVPLALEYEAVLLRHAEELGFSRAEAVGLVDYLCGLAHKQPTHFLWRPALSDPGDEFVLELAVAAKCEAIVTHNRQDFRGATRFGIPVITPADFRAWLKEE